MRSSFIAYNDGGAGDLGHLAERIVVIVVRRAQIGLACGQPCLHLDVEEPVLHAEAFLLRGEVFDAPLARL